MSIRIVLMTLSLMTVAACGDRGGENPAPGATEAAQAAALNEGPRAATVLAVVPERAARGEILYSAKSCADCHTLGEADLAPDLVTVLDKRTLPWLLKQITEPEWMLAHDPITQALYAEYDLEMVDMDVSTDEAEDILHYVLREAGLAARE
jgi:mono/diheme cytochrome c family protein